MQDSDYPNLFIRDVDFTLFLNRMKQAQRLTYSTISSTSNFNRLPRVLREAAAESKYADAVRIYFAASLPLCEVADMCGVTAVGLSAYIGKHHRRLLFEKYGLDPDKYDIRSLKEKPPKDQSLNTHLKYKDATEACGDIAYIEYNVSQIARMFHQQGQSLPHQLYTHDPEVMPNREKAQTVRNRRQRTQWSIR